MPKLSYEEIRRIQEQSGQGHLPTDAFASMMNALSGTRDYDAGVGTGLGSLVHRFNYGLNQALDYTGVPQFMGGVGGQLFGEAGEQAFSAVPRMAVDMLPLLAGGPLGLGAKAVGLGMGATQGIGAYGATDSVPAAAAGVGIGMMTGGFANAGGALGRGTAGMFGVNTAPKAFSAATTAGAAELAPALATRMATQPIYGMGARVATATGQQVGVLANNLLANAAPAAIAADKGQGWEAFKEQFTPVNIAATALAQSPFAPKMIRKTLRKTPDQLAMEKNASTFEKYYNTEMLPREIRTQLQQEVAQRVQSQQLALPAPRTDRDIVGYRPVQPVTEVNEVRQSVAKLDREQLFFNRALDARLRSDQAEFVPENTVKQPSVERFEDIEGNGFVLKRTYETPEFVEAIKQVAPELVPTPSARPSWDFAKLEPGQRIKLLNDPRPEVSVPAALAETQTSPVIVAQNIDNLTSRGVTVSDAVEEVAMVESAKAKVQVEETVKKMSSLEQQRQAKAQAEKERKASEATGWWNQWSRDLSKSDPELLEQLVDKFASVDMTTQKYLSTTLFNKVRAWAEADGKNKGVLFNELNAAIKRQKAKHRNDSVSFPVIGVNEQGLAMLGEQGKKGVRRDKAGTGVHINYNSLIDAQQARNGFAAADKEHSYVVVKSKTKENTWHVNAHPWEQTTISPELVDAAIADAAKAGVEMPATRPAQVKAVEVLADVDEFLARYPLENDPGAADVAAEYGKGALKVLLEEAKRGALQVGKKHDTIAEILKHGVFPDKSAVLSAYGRAADMLQEFVFDVKEVKATGTVRKMLGMEQKEFAAGGGFFFNMMPLDRGRIGKHTVGNNPVLDEATFLKAARGTDVPLKKAELEFYKLLVPEAFEGGKVDVVKLQEGLKTAEASLRVDVYGQSDGTEVRLAQLTHEWYDNLSPAQRFVADQYARSDRPLTEQEKAEVAKIPEQQKLEEYRQLTEEKAKGASDDESSPRATAYYNTISPFDTKKYPVLRVDVSLATKDIPSRKMVEAWEDVTPEQLTPAEREAKAKLLWSPDKTHENLPNTIGWAMVQIVPDPRTGEQIMFVAEQQSRWGQERYGWSPKKPVTSVSGEDWKVHFNDKDIEPKFYQKRNYTEQQAFEAAKQYGLSKVPPHPSLEFQHELVLNAVMAEARKRGISKIAISDAESAMMTEKHDLSRQAFNVDQATVNALADKFQLEKSVVNGVQDFQKPGKGFVARYKDGKLTIETSAMDKELLSYAAAQDWIMAEPLESGGMRLHYDTTLPSTMKRLTGDSGEVVDFGVHKNALSGEKIIGSPVFRNADGTPRANVAGKVYTIPQKFDSVSRMGDQTDSPLVGEQMPLGRLLREVGLTEPEHLNEAIRLASLLERGDEIGFAALRQQPGQQEVGLFTVQTDGQKLVWLANTGSTNQKLFAMAHEFTGHGIWQLHKEGKLDPKSAAALDNYAKFVGEASPDDLRVMLNETWKMLPERYRKDEGLKKLAEARVTDPEENMANLNAIISLSLVNAKPSKWQQFMRWMPEPVAKFVGAVIKTGRKMFEAIAGNMFVNRLRNKQFVETAHEKLLNDYIDTTYKLLRVDAKREADLATAVRLQMAQDPKKFNEFLLSGEALNTPLDSSSARVLRAFGITDSLDKGLKSPVAERVREFVRPVVKGFDSFIAPISRVAKQHPVLRKLASMHLEQEFRTNEKMLDVMRVLAMDWDGVKWVSDKNSPVLKVETDPFLSKARDQLVQRAQVMGKPAHELLASGDADAVGAIARFNPEQKKVIRESIDRMMKAQSMAIDFINQMQQERLVFTVGKMLMYKDNALTGSVAEAQAKQMIEAVRSGSYTGPDMDTSAFVSKALGRISDAYEWYKARPWWVSERRFGDFEITWTYKDPKKPAGRVRFKTEGERIAALQQLESERAAKGIAEIKTKNIKVEPFDARQAALDVWSSRERENNEDLSLALQKLGLPVDKVREIVDDHSLVADMQRELAMKQLPSRMVTRKFADGREMLDMLSQQLDSLSLLMHGMSKGITNTKHSMYMLDPSVREHENAPLFKQAWEQFRKPDPESVRMVQKFSYYSWLSLNTLNMLQDAVQPITGALVPDMINDGASVGQAYARAMRYMGRLRSGKLAADEKAVLERYRKGNRGIASYSDEVNNDLLSAIDTTRLVRGKETTHIGHKLKSGIGGLLLMNKKFHKKFTDFGMESAFLAAYDHMKQVKKLSNADAEDAAREFVATSMGAWGKGGRAVGIWASDKLKPASAILTALQTYATNQIAAWKNYAEAALSGQKGLNAGQRAQALKAFGSHSAMMFAHAGLLGLPFVGAALSIIDKVFGINSKKEIAELVTSEEDDEDTAVIKSQVALHGMLNLLGADIASRSSASGVLGINNMNGFSLESLAGPTYSMLSKMFQGTTEMVQARKLDEFAGGASKVFLPNQLQKAVQFAKDGSEFRRPDGTLLTNVSDTQKAMYYALGVKPTNVSRLQEAESWARADAELEADERKDWMNDVLDLFVSGETEKARAAMISQVEKRPDVSLQALASALATRLVERQIGKDPRRSPGYSESLGQLSGGLNTGISELQRQQMVAQVMAQMGFGMPASRLNSAAEVDAMRSSLGRPYLPFSDANSLR